MIEEDFICADNSVAPSRRSYCSYTKQLVFELLESEKHIYKNRLNLTYSIKPILRRVLETYPELTSRVSFEPASLKVKTNSAWYLPEEQKLVVQVDYDENVQDKNLTIVFRIPQTAETFAVPISRSTHEIAPDNNLAALAHEDETY